MKKVPVLPTLLTLGNCLCGYGAIIYAGRATQEEFGVLESAGGLILLAMLFDALDGKIARLTNMSTQFGGQLDSIADIVSFGIAPSFLVWKVLTIHFVKYPGYVWLVRMGWLVGALFLMAAAIRLARFNVHNDLEDEGHEFFLGLPSPAAAGTIAAFIILHKSILEDYGKDYVAAVIPFVALILAVLMISKIRYSHLTHGLFKDRRNFGFLSIMLIVGIAVAYTYWFSLTIIFSIYVISGIVGVAVEQILDRIELSHEKNSFF